MKTLDKMEANLLLDEIGLKIGSWNQIQTKDQSHIGDWINVQAPRAYLLECAQHCAGWLPKGRWKIFQIDNSTGWIDPVRLIQYKHHCFSDYCTEKITNIIWQTGLFCSTFRQVEYRMKKQSY